MGEEESRMVDEGCPNADADESSGGLCPICSHWAGEFAHVFRTGHHVACPTNDIDSGVYSGAYAPLIGRYPKPGDTRKCP